MNHNPFPEKTTRAEREFAMDQVRGAPPLRWCRVVGAQTDSYRPHGSQELKWSAAKVAAPVLLDEYDEEAERSGQTVGLPRDRAHDIHVPPEVRFTGAQQLPPSHPPLPWNPKLVTPIWFETRGPHDAPPDDAYEWARTGRRADAGRRRYSAYASMNNRDGPRMMPGLHPSRSALRPMAPTSVRCIGPVPLRCKRPARGEGARLAGPSGNRLPRVHARRLTKSSHACMYAPAEPYPRMCSSAALESSRSKRSDRLQTRLSAECTAT